MKKTSHLTLLMAIAAVSGTAIAEPFNDCPKSGFLVQGSQAAVYGVDLSTGFYRVLKDVVPTKNKVNGVGFNIHDHFMYGWDYKSGTLARVNSAFDVFPLTLNAKPNSNFFVGDVSLTSNTYYMYRRGKSSGLYKVDLSALAGLNETDSQGVELPVSRVIDGEALDLRIFDIAFHPNKNVAYTVDSNARLIELNPDTGSAKIITTFESDKKGTYGAVYFDSSASLFISRNQDGKIFKITVDDAEPKAEFFAQGPKSGINDGARCAEGEAIEKVIPTYDFGDAPSSYKTFLEDDGPHHLLGGSLTLGTSIDADADAYGYPLSDDENGDQPQGHKDNDDEDGIEFLSPMIPGKTAIFKVNVSETGGYLNGWFDWNQNGIFEPEEAIFEQPEPLTSLSTLLTVAVPESAAPSNATSPKTWARFRVANDNTEIAQPTGEAKSGEVEDYALLVDKKEEEEVRYYPSKNGFSTLVYEDNWPLQGDYDLNDLVVHFRSAMGYIGDKVDRLDLEGEFVSIGAKFHSGFAIRLPDVLKSQLKDLPTLYLNGIEQTDVTVLEDELNEVSLIISPDLLDLITWADDSCEFYRTEKKDICALPISNSYKLHLEFNEPIAASSFPKPPFDPFIFATPEKPRNPYVNDGTGKYVENKIFDAILGDKKRPGRGLEIHLKGKGYTSLFNTELLKLAGSVASDGNDPFVTKNGMPWAMEFNTEWSYPSEYKDVIYVYYKFRNFILKSGSEDKDWFVLKDNPSFNAATDEEKGRFLNANAESLYDY